MSDSPPIALHRCRFVDASPSPITALAFPPAPLPSLSTKATGKQRERDRSPAFGTLVVGHANGNIGLLEWTGELGESQASQAWHHRKTLPGPRPSKVDSLALTIRFPDIFLDRVPSLSDLRLFSSGGGSELLEWDIVRKTVRRTVSSQGGSIWSVAANHASTLLALGCEDGCIRLLSLAADTFEHFRRFDHVKCRILSIAWGPPVPQQYRPKMNGSTNRCNDREESDDSDDEDYEWTDLWLVTGGSDSSLRKWDISTGRPTDRMGTDKMKGERTLVWTAGVLADGTIISGDSLGTVKFWDPITCTQTRSFTAHGADVLCLAIGPDGTTVFTSGVDQKIVQFTYVSSTPGSTPSALSAATSRWIMSGSRRMHSHDVRSLAMWPPYSPLPPAYKRKPTAGAPFIAPVLVSGGLDMSVVLTPCLPASTTTSTVAARVVNPLATNTATTFEDSCYRRIPYTSTVSVAKGARLVACMRAAGVNIWRVLNIPNTATIMDGTDYSTDPELRVSWESVLEMELNVQTNLISSALSDDGRWLAVSDLYETKLFELCKTPTGEMKPRRSRSLTAVLEVALCSSSGGPRSTGGNYFVFTPDSIKMILASASTSAILIIDLSTEEPSVLRRFDQHTKLSPVNGGRLVRGSSRSQAQDADITNDDIPQSDGPPTVVRMAVSPDMQWLVTSDELCRTFVFNLDSIQYHRTLPSLPHPPNVLTFVPEKPQILMIVLPNNTIHIFDVERSEVPAWAHDLNPRIPKQLFSTPDPILGVIFEPAPASVPVDGGVKVTQHHSRSGSTALSQKEAIIWGASWLCKLKLDLLEKHSEPRKRRKSEARHPPQGHHGMPTLAPRGDLQNSAYDARNLRIVTHYRPILALDFVGPREMVLVERPLVDVLSELPPAFFKPKYGQT